MSWALAKDRFGRIPLLGPLARGLWAGVRWTRRELAWRRHLLRSPRPVAPREAGAPLRVAIVGHHPSLVRERKLAAAARLEGLRVTLISTSPADVSQLAAEVDAAHVARDAAQVLGILEERPVDVVHVVAPATGSLLMLRVLRHCAAPTVYDPYDCTEGFIKPEHAPPAERIAMERECFRLADRVCSRSLEPLHLRRQLGYEMGPATFFPDYCWKLPRRRARRLVGPDDELHVVYAGGIRPEDRFPSDRWGYSQYLEVGRILASQRIHLHVYPAPLPGRDDMFDEYFSAYLEEQERSPYFHFYRPVSSERLAELLPGHDAAIQVLGPQVSKALGWNTAEKLRHSSANKLFDYIEAGLPVILHAGRLQRALTRRFGELVALDDLHEARSELVRLLSTEPREPSRSATLAYHSRRLHDMYRSLEAAAEKE